jgi:quercetin dioxygenase-like cupin family protein
MRIRSSHLGFALVLLLGSTAVGTAQAPAFKRTELQRADLSVPGREVVIVMAEIPKGVETGRHTHPGEEVSYLAEGSIVLEIEGQAARTIKAGETFIVPAGRVHNARNEQSAMARVVANYIIEKGKPVATPAP